MKLIKSVVFIVILLVIVLIFYNLLNKNINFIGNNQNNTTLIKTKRISKKEKKEFIFFYSENVRTKVFQKIVNKENPICSGNCKEIYGISNNDIDFEVVDIQTNYEVIYRALETGKYNGINLANKDCTSIPDTSCNGNIIKNYISKEWMK